VQPERASGRRRLLTWAGLQASVEQAAADISSILASEKKKKTKKVDANKMAALALIFNPVRCARRSGAARRRLLLTPFFSPSSSHPILLTLFPVLAPDTGSHRVALGGEWALGQNRPARRKGHPRCVPLNALLLFLSQTWLPPALWFCFVTDFVIVSPAAPVVCRPTLYSAFPRTLNRAVLRAGELVLKCAAGGVARCRTWAA